MVCQTLNAQRTCAHMSHVSLTQWCTIIGNLVHLVGLDLLELNLRSWVNDAVTQMINLVSNFNQRVKGPY